jgi:hypothetical protein
MNRKEIIKNTARISEVDIDDCEKVINALEKVLEDEFSSSQGLSSAFDKFCKLINVFKIKLI